MDFNNHQTPLNREERDRMMQAWKEFQVAIHNTQYYDILEAVVKYHLENTGNKFQCAMDLKNIQRTLAAKNYVWGLKEAKEFVGKHWITEEEKVYNEFVDNILAVDDTAFRDSVAYNFCRNINVINIRFDYHNRKHLSIERLALS